MRLREPYEGGGRWNAGQGSGLRPLAFEARGEMAKSG